MYVVLIRINISGPLRHLFRDTLLKVIATSGANKRDFLKLEKPVF